MSGYYSIPVTKVDVPFYEIGEAKLFADDGLVVLGNTAFNRFAKIVDHSFAGCVANRGDDGVLVITSPVETYRFHYKPGMECWFQQIPDRSEDAPPYLIGRWRESVRDYGIILSLIFLPFRVLLWLLQVYLSLMEITFVLGFVLVLLTGFVFAIAVVVNKLCIYYWSVGPLDPYLPN